MIKISHLLIALSLLAFACKKSQKETANGFKYTLLKEGSGEKATKDQILVFDFELRDSKDSLWNNSYQQGLPAAMQIPDTAGMKSEDGITQMLRELREGDSVKATLSVPEFFNQLVKRPVPPTIDSTLALTYTINVSDVMDLPEFLSWRAGKVKDRDDKMIKEYLQENNINAQQDTSGLYFVIHNEGGKNKPGTEDCVEVKYEGRFLKDGRIFDKNEKVAFNLNRVIPGWTLGVSKLGKGDSATFYIPSALAYGDRGYYGIPPDAVLIFDVTLLNSTGTYDQATQSCK